MVKLVIINNKLFPMKEVLILQVMILMTTLVKNNADTEPESESERSKESEDENTNAENINRNKVTQNESEKILSL